MVLQVNYDAVQGGSMKSGEYEIIVSEYKGKNPSPWGTEQHEIVLTVRNDIQQPSKNALIFLNYTDDVLNQYPNFWNAPSKALGLPNGQTYNSYEEIFTAWVGRPAKVKVEVEKEVSNGKEYEKKKVKYWDATQYPNVQHVQKQKQQKQQQPQPQGVVYQQQVQQPAFNQQPQQQPVTDDLPFITGDENNAPF